MSCGSPRPGEDMNNVFVTELVDRLVNDLGARGVVISGASGAEGSPPLPLFELSLIAATIERSRNADPGFPGPRHRPRLIMKALRAWV